MRIIAGEFRRRKLFTNPGLTTRPITDRVKVILFDRLDGLFSDVRVADIFAGTGSMGLEALSRGAASAVFIERDHKAHSLLVENVKMLGAESRTLCWRTDALRSSFRPKGVPAFVPFDVVFFDPPYQMAAEIRPGTPITAALERLAGSEVTSSTARLIYRCARADQFQFPAPWKIEEQFTVNSMDLYLFAKGMSDPAMIAEGELPSPLK
jgi:16S rRNA (guanine966-N2)-methyltransferase